VALADFFERIYSAVGGQLNVSRDDLTAALVDVVVGIKCAPNLSTNDIWVAELSTNLLARLYPRIAITGPESQCSKLRQLACSINPILDVLETAPPETTISVGPIESASSLYPSAGGWVARLGHKYHLGSGPTNPYAAAAAATFASAELFRRVFLKTPTEPDIALSLLNFDRNTGEQLKLPKSNFGDVLFVGLGAVGNAAVWALARDEKREGRISLVDNEKLDLSNLQRYVLGLSTEIGKDKVVLAAETLRQSQLAVETAKVTLEEFAEEKGGITIPTLCISVDNVPTRRAAQALLPRLILNGWTGERALGASWHVFSRKAACLSCLYFPLGQGISQTDQAARALGLTPERAALLWMTRQPLSDDDIKVAASKLGIDKTFLEPWRGKPLGEMYTDVVCGAVPLNLPITGRVEMVPLAHQSALAGILMATELVKRTVPGLAKRSQPEPLVSWEDVLLPPPSSWPKPRAREKGCICGDKDYQRAYRKKWRNATHRSSRRSIPS